MPSVHRSRLMAAGRTKAPDDVDIRICSVLLASVVSMMLLCAQLSLLSSVSGDGAFPFTKLRIFVIVGPTAVLFVLVCLGWLVASGIRALQAAAPQAPAPASLARRLCACGLSDAAGVAATLPAFPFQPAQPAAASEGEGEPRGSAVLCTVCLEDVRGSEMVRQLPACRHLFHVWLRSHRTCPLCRCELPRRNTEGNRSADRGRHVGHARSGAVAACLSPTNVRATCRPGKGRCSSLEAILAACQDVPHSSIPEFLT